MRRYETIVIVDPDLSEEGRGPVFDRVKDIIPQQGGTLVDIEDWGSKRLAYEIKKKQRGFYTRLDYCGTGAVVDEMERFFRIDDRIMKFMTIVISENADPEALLAEKAAAAAVSPSENSVAETAPEAEATEADTTANDEED
ncbi:MAG: 30S ribosomal protein S6 [Pseudomonadota bacterium]